jgi:hypothetical protein
MVLFETAGPLRLLPALSACAVMLIPGTGSICADGERFKKGFGTDWRGMKDGRA